MNRGLNQRTIGAAGRMGQMWLHVAVAVVLLILAAFADATKPFGKSWSVLYMLPVLYVGWQVRGPAEVVTYATAIGTVFLIPLVFRPEALSGGAGLFNRSLGTLLGLVVIFLMWERRRGVVTLESANEELEKRVAERVRELEIANEKLAEDIEQRQRAEQELRESEARFRTFADHAADAFFLHDDQGVVCDVNQQACESLGYTREELIGMNPIKFDSEMTTADMQQISQRLAAGESPRFDSTHRRKDGTQFPVEVRIRPFELRGQRFGLSLARDMSERQSAEQELRETEQRFRRLSDSAFEGLMIHEQGVVRDANQAFANLFGLGNVQELIGRYALDMLPLTAESKETIREQLRSPSEGVFEITTQQLDGTMRFLETQGRDVTFRGRAARVVALRDVTERKLAEEQRHKLEEQVQQAQKLESLGVMAGGVAHDFNNLLTVINGNSHLLRNNLEQNDPRQGFACAIHAAGTQAAKLTRQLLMFSRGVPQQPEALDLNAVIEQAAEIWRQVVGETIAVELDCVAGLWPVVVDRSQIEQVLLNLVLNARDAMPEGGRILVKTRNVELPLPANGALSGSVGDAELAGKQRGGGIQISVEDTGVGMSERVRARIFEPFFTTKDVGQGTGLGLPMCHGIVRQSGGWIEVSSEPDRGSTFCVVLPSETNVNRSLPAERSEMAAAAGSP